MDSLSRLNTKDEAPFITVLTRQKTDLDPSIPQADTINNLFGQINSCISVYSI